MRPEGTIDGARYDVFISYMSQDRVPVHRIAEHLRDQHGLRIWLDDWMLRPGQPLLDNIENGLRESHAIAVFVGAHGLGPWETSEYRSAVARQISEKTPVIPVLLPGALERASGHVRLEHVLPPTLQQNLAINFARGLDDEVELNRLVWGITGRNPLASESMALGAPQAPPAVAMPGDMDVMDAVVQDVLKGDITILLGRSAAGARYPQHAAPFELSARLLRELSLVGDGYDGLVPGMESVASLLAATRGEVTLERSVIDILERAGDTQPEVHKALAVLMRLLGRRPPERRARRRAPRLILTTNFDLLLERALLRAGIQFSRLVQFRGEPRIDVTVFDDVALAAGGDILVGGKRAPAANGDDLDGLIYGQEKRSVRARVTDNVGGNSIASLAIDQLPDPILYKFQGSQDIKNSCAISADHCFDFVTRLLEQECVPKQISEIIGSSTLIALGASVLDQDFRLIYHTLLRKQWEINPNRRYTIGSRADVDRRDPSLKLAESDWKAIKSNTLGSYRIDSVDAPPAEFLTELTAKLAGEWGLVP